MDSLVYVIAGKEESLVSAQCRELLDELLEPSQRTTGLFSPDPADVTVTDCLDELRTAPFLTEKRVVVLKKRWQLPQRLIEYTKDAYGKNLTREAAELLVELTGDELPRLYSEIDKLSAYADKDKAITQKHIESLIGHNRLFNAFAVIDAITAGDSGTAVQRLRGMFTEDRSAEYTVIGAFAFHFRRMFNAKVLLEKGMQPGEIVKQLRLWGNQDKFFTQLRKIPLKKIGQYMKFLAETDYAIKTGRAKAQIEMEQFVLRLAN